MPNTTPDEPAKRKRYGRNKAPKFCEVEGCTRPHATSGMCHTHRSRKARGIDPNLPIKAPNRTYKAGEAPKVCTVDGCGRKHKGRGYCEGHLKRWRNGGDVNVPLRRYERTVKYGEAPESCTHPGCEKPNEVKGLCQMHGYRKEKGLDMDEIGLRDPQRLRRWELTCSFYSCSNPVYTREVCSKHYTQYLDNRTDIVCKIGGCGAGVNCRGYCRFHYHILRNFKIAPETWEQMYSDQEGLCAICEKPTSRKEMHTDHDHACCPEGGRGCGKCVRALLCRGCNVGLGNFSDSPSALRAAAVYIEKHLLSAGM